jgi:DNA-directed RNA polymerase subunit RPC12/RpoP
MAKDVYSVTCPCCSAPLRFDGGEGKLRCDSCGNEFEKDVMRQVDEALNHSAQASEMNWKHDAAQAWSEEERASLHSYTCTSCGAEIVADDTTASSECVYCGNPSILPGRLSGDFRPDAVLPFVKTKQDAQDAYKALIRGKRLLPKLFGQENRIEKITGVYVPFWMFGCDAEADITYRAERKTTRTRGNYIITDTDHFLVLRGGEIGFAGVPVDGSSKFDDTLMEAIEPYDHGGEAAFSTAYLPGFQAERYDVDAEAAKPRADERIRQSVSDAFARTVEGYGAVSMQSASIRLEHGDVRNVMIPVWMLNTRWKDKTYTFAMNGQTGKIVGSLPVDKGLAFKWGLGLFAGSFLVMLAAAYALFATGVM